MTVLLDSVLDGLTLTTATIPSCRTGLIVTYSASRSNISTEDGSV